MEIMVLGGVRVPLFEIFDFSAHLNLDFVTIYSPTWFPVYIMIAVMSVPHSTTALKVVKHPPHILEG